MFLEENAPISETIILVYLYNEIGAIFQMK